MVPRGLGAIVESVLFREVEKPQIPMSGSLGEAGQEDKVTWELTSEAKAGNVLTLTIDGEGNMLSTCLATSIMNTVRARVGRH